MKYNHPIKQADEVRSTALNIIHDVLERGAYANLRLERELRNSILSASDRRLVTELVNGTIRMLKHLDWVLNLFLKKPIIKQNPWVRNVLRMAVYQILFMDKIPAYAAVNAAVNLTSAKVSSALAGMVNAVLRNIIRYGNKIEYPSQQNDIVSYLAVYYSHPEWMVKNWLDEYGYEKTVSILTFNNIPGDVTLRCNQLVGNRDELLMELDKEGITAKACDSFPPALKLIKMDKPVTETAAFKEGWFYIQDCGSMLAAPILMLQPGQIVYDLCCGVGGKTTHAAEYMQNQGRITAIDLYEHKIELLNWNAERLGINIIEPVAQDILGMDTSTMLRAPRVMLDAPCSGLGVLNRRADARWRKSYDELKRLTEVQEALLIRAANLVDKDGLLLYSTCTNNHYENEDIINSFLKKNKKFSPEGFESALKYLLLSDDEKQSASKGMFNLLPGRHGTNGMFFALMRRN